MSLSTFKKFITVVAAAAASVTLPAPLVSASDRAPPPAPKRPALGSAFVRRDLFPEDRDGGRDQGGNAGSNRVVQTTQDASRRASFHDITDVQQPGRAGSRIVLSTLLTDGFVPTVRRLEADRNRLVAQRQQGHRRGNSVVQQIAFFEQGNQVPSALWENTPANMAAAAQWTVQHLVTHLATQPPAHTEDEVRGFLCVTFAEADAVAENADWLAPQLLLPTMSNEQLHVEQTAAASAHGPTTISVSFVNAMDASNEYLTVAHHALLSDVMPQLVTPALLFGSGATGNARIARMWTRMLLLEPVAGTSALSRAQVDSLWQGRPHLVTVLHLVNELRRREGLGHIDAAVLREMGKSGPRVVIGLHLGEATRAEKKTLVAQSELNALARPRNGNQNLPVRFVNSLTQVEYHRVPHATASLQDAMAAVEDAINADGGAYRTWTHVVLSGPAVFGRHSMAQDQVRALWQRGTGNVRAAVLHLINELRRQNNLPEVTTVEDNEEVRIGVLVGEPVTPRGRRQLPAFRGVSPTPGPRAGQQQRHPGSGGQWSTSGGSPPAMGAACTCFSPLDFSPVSPLGGGGAAAAAAADESPLMYNHFNFQQAMAGMHPGSSTDAHGTATGSGMPLAPPLPTVGAATAQDSPWNNHPEAFATNELLRQLLAYCEEMQSSHPSSPGVDPTALVGTGLQQDEDEMEVEQDDQVGDEDDVVDVHVDSDLESDDVDSQGNVFERPPYLFSSDDEQELP
eukprot:g6485.t1